MTELRITYKRLLQWWEFRRQAKMNDCDHKSWTMKLNRTHEVWVCDGCPYVRHHLRPRRQ